MTSGTQPVLGSSTLHVPTPSPPSLSATIPTLARLLWDNYYIALPYQSHSGIYK